MIRGRKNAPMIHRIMQHHRRGSPILNSIRRASSVDRNRSVGTPTPPSTVVLLRHGQSLWNQIPTFSGWCDVPLTDLGIEQAKGAARVMKEKGFDFDLVYSSELKRAYETAEAVLEVLDDTTATKKIVPMKTWELNERQYVYKNYLRDL